MSQPPERIVFFDGICAVCDAGVRWIVDHDAEARFHFAPLQGSTASELLAQHPELPTTLDSIILLERGPGGSRVSWHTEALLRIAAELPAPWRWLWWFRFVPAFLRDPFYRAFAAVRYRVFGTIDSCRLPTESEQERMLP